MAINLFLGLLSAELSFYNRHCNNIDIAFKLQNFVYSFHSVVANRTILYFSQ